MLKFDFSVKTRDGQKVESIQIQGRDLPDAEQKLFHMYRYCGVINRKTIDTSHDNTQVDIEDVLSLIAKQSAI